MVARKQTAKWIFIAIGVGLAVIAIFFIWAASASSQGGGGSGSELDTLLPGTAMPTAATVIATTPAP